MTEKFDKFDKWSYLDCNCNRRIKNDAPDEIKAEAKKPMKNTLIEPEDICLKLITN